jgi:hypothetical protein
VGSIRERREVWDGRIIMGAKTPRENIDNQWRLKEFRKSGKGEEPLHL